MSNAPTVRPPDDACCPKCKRILIDTHPCECAPMPRALRQFEELIGTLLSMTGDERREFIAITGDRMVQAFRGERESYTQIVRR